MEATVPPGTDSPDLWTLVLHYPHIDPERLASALEQEARKPSLDFRTRLLIRDALSALRAVWGAPRQESWKERSAARETFAAIEREQLGPPGFPFLRNQLMESIHPHTILAMLRELGQAVDTPSTMAIGARPPSSCRIGRRA